MDRNNRLSINEVAGILRISRQTLYRRVYDGLLHVTRHELTGRVYIDFDDFAAFLRQWEITENCPGTAEPTLIQARQLITGREAAKAARPKPVPLTGWDQIRQEVIARDGRICRLCGNAIKDEPHIDHIIPRIEGGTNALDNLRVTCARCNHSRGARPRADFVPLPPDEREALLNELAAL